MNKESFFRTIENLYQEISSNKKKKIELYKCLDAYDVYKKSLNKLDIEDDTFDKKVQIMADIRNTKAILAFTNNNTVNLSIIATAKKLNPDIITMAREENADDFSIFTNAHIDYLFIPSKIMFNKTINALLNPLSDMFISSFVDQHEIWAQKLTRKLIETIDEDPIIYELGINKGESPQVYKALSRKDEVSLEIFSTSLYNREHKNNVIPLLLVRNGEKFMLPDWNIKLQHEDKILFACDKNSKNDIEYIAQNAYEFQYALTGEERRLFSGFRLKNKN